jgi:hypothetical protein
MKTNPQMEILTCHREVMFSLEAEGAKAYIHRCLQTSYKIVKHLHEAVSMSLLDPCTQSGSRIAHYHLPVEFWCKSHPDIDSANHLQRTLVFHMPHNLDIPETRSAITVCT